MVEVYNLKDALKLMRRGYKLLDYEISSGEGGHVVEVFKMEWDYSA